MLRITVDDSQLQAAFNRLRQAASDLTPAFNDVGEFYIRKIDNQFRTETDPFGAPWASLKPKTIKSKRGKGQILKVLQATGLFRASFSYDAGADFAEIGSNRVTTDGQSLGILHQLGSGRLPKREILPNAERGLPESDLQEVLEIIGEHIENAW